MATKALTDAQCLEALDALNRAGGNKVHAALAINLPRQTFQHRLGEAHRRKLVSNVPVVDEAAVLRDQVRLLETQLKQQHQDEITATRVRQQIIKVSQQSPDPPNWLVRPSKQHRSSPGVPTLFLSDLHWGEVVDPSQINGLNEYNLAIAQKRMRHCIDTTIDLLKHHVVNPNYPGIVLALGGDMVSGDIHEELSVTNEREIMPTFVDLFGVMVWVIETLADQFGRVFVTGVTGNHGRNTKYIRAKGRTATSFDWLLYVLLERHFQNDKRASFMIPNGPDAYYRIFNHRYLLTHGDQFRGGDSMIGPLGPITRGDHKKRSRNSQIGQEYDTLIMGHWHQLIMLRKLIVNSSLKGYDEYANANNFPYEPPSQALWMTHPDYGITISMPVYVDRVRHIATPEWVGWSETPTAANL